MPAPSASAERWILAVETATTRAGVALLRGDVVVAERDLPEGVSASEGLLPAIDAVLGEAGVALSALAGVALSIGPGSFTGLRIGTATVMGLSFGRDQPVAPVPTLAALALGAPPGAGPVVATLDARRGDLYAAGYPDPRSGRPEALPEGLYDLEALRAALPRPCRVVGEGVAIHGEALAAAGAVVERTAATTPRARDVGRIGSAWLAAGRGVPAAALVPRYVRRAEAEARRTGEATEPAPGPDGAL